MCLIANDVLAIIRGKTSYHEAESPGASELFDTAWAASEKDVPISCLYSISNGSEPRITRKNLNRVIIGPTEVCHRATYQFGGERSLFRL